MSTYRLGVLGYPLSHTRSPILHQTLLAECHLTGSYDKLEVSPETFASWVETQASTYHGFNVTIPYKVSLMPYLQQVSKTAQWIGAVNTVTVTPQGLVGDNTDAAGFLAPLSQSAQAALQGGHALILGSGGASRAVAYALGTAGVHQITVRVRDVARATPTLEAIQSMGKALGKPSHVAGATTVSKSVLQQVCLVVNTTPVGMHPNPDISPLTQAELAQLPSHCLVYDLVYNPQQTLLLSQAQACGLPTQHGLGMLVHQGALSFQIWTGCRISADMLQIAEDALIRAMITS